MSSAPDTLTFRDGMRGANKETFFKQLHGPDAPPLRKEEAFWVVSGFDEARSILLDHKRFSSSQMGGFLPLLSDDQPRHTTLRSLLSKAFTPSAIEALRPWVESLANDITATIAKGEEVDIVDKLTSPLPIAVIARMMGIPGEDAPRFRRWSNALVGLQDGPMDGERMKSMADLRAYFLEQAADRRAHPGEDLITAMLRADEAGIKLTDDQTVGFCLLLLVAGNETTTNLLGNLLNRLARKPGDWARMKANPALVEAAIEESLRMDSPAQMVIRSAIEDAEIAGQTIKKGEMVMVYLAAANRDPEKWNEPSLFEIARERDRHVAFGQGIHTCIGAPLSRLEAQCVMSALVARFDDIAPGAAKAQRLRSGMLNGFQALPVIFS